MKKLKLQSNSSALLHIQLLKITVLVILYLIVSMFSLSAQTPRKESGADGLSMKYLNIGDTIPQALWDLKFKTVGHVSPNKEQTLRDYLNNKKLVVLDFWATWCSTCIASFPDLYKLQDDMGAQVKVLSVTYQDRAAIEKFISKSEFIQSQGLGNKFASIVDDKILTKYFKKDGIPFSVCIDNKGVVRSLSMPSELNVAALEQMIHDPHAVPVASLVLKFDKPLLEPYYDSKINPYYYSVLLPYGLGIAPTRVFNVDSVHRIKQLVVPNQNMFMQYAEALITDPNFAIGIAKIPSRRILQVSNTESMHERLDADQNLKEYTYESVSPLGYADTSIYRKMENDLDFHFGMKASYQLRNMDCLVLRVKDPKKLIISQHSAKSATVILNGLMTGDGTQDGKYLQKADKWTKSKNAVLDVTIKDIPNLFNRLHIAILPFMIDESGLKDRVSIALPDNISDMAQLKRAFEEQGLALSLEKRKIMMLVLTEDGYQNNAAPLKLTRYGYTSSSGKESLR